MKLYIYKSKTNTTFYMVKAYRTNEGKSTSKIIEKLGTLEEVKKRLMVKFQLFGQKNTLKKKQMKKMKTKEYTTKN